MLRVKNCSFVFRQNNFLNSKMFLFWLNNMKVLSVSLPERFVAKKQTASKTIFKFFYSSEIKFSIPNQQFCSKNPLTSVFCPGRSGMRTFISLLNCLIKGVSKPYFLRFYVRGIGFKVWPLLNYYGIRGRLGFNHKSLYIFSRGLIGRGRKYKFVLSSISRSQLRQAAVDVVKLRNPDVYRVKGVRFLGDNLFPKPRKDKRK